MTDGTAGDTSASGTENPPSLDERFERVTQALINLIARVEKRVDAMAYEVRTKRLVVIDDFEAERIIASVSRADDRAEVEVKGPPKDGYCATLSAAGISGSSCVPSAGVYVTADGNQAAAIDAHGVHSGHPGHVAYLTLTGPERYESGQRAPQGSVRISAYEAEAELNLYGGSRPAKEDQSRVTIHAGHDESDAPGATITAHTADGEHHIDAELGGSAAAESDELRTALHGIAAACTAVADL